MNIFDFFKKFIFNVRFKQLQVSQKAISSAWGSIFKKKKTFDMSHK